MADPAYVRSTDGSDSDGGTTWALAKATITSAITVASTAGDRVFMSQAHAESAGSAITWTFPGTAAAPSKLICGNDAAEPPTAVATTATVTTTGATAITISGALQAYGLTLFCGSGISNANISLSATAALPQYYESCAFRLAANGVSGRINAGLATTTANGGPLTWVNCDVRFANASQVIQLNAVRFRWSGGALLSGGTSPTSLFSQAGALGRSSDVIVEGVDFSNASAGMNLVGTADVGSHFIFRNCRMPASWSGALLLTAVTGNRVELYNCDSGDTNYRLWIDDYAGSIKTESVIVRTGGYGSTGANSVPLSWKMTTNANAVAYTTPLISPDLPARFNTTVGSAITVTVEIVHDSATNLKNDEVYLKMMYLGTSGVPLATLISDDKADMLATAADQTDSSATWTTTGLSTPNTQLLSVTFTPQEEGYIQGWVVMAKASKALYVDPKMQVS